MNKKIKLALIYGSNREGRFCDVVAGWAINQLNNRSDFELTIVDPGQIRLPHRMEKTANPDLNDFRQKIKEADAFVIVTPEYNHGYPAPLKFLIDSEYEGWRTKPVAFISYGGISGGIRAVEQLRQVFCELHAMTIRDSVSLINGWEQFDKTGNLIQPEKMGKILSAMLNQLLWWATALRDARMSQPYTLA